MSKGTYPLKLPDSIKREAQRLAKEDGVSLNQWISSAVSQKVGAVQTAAEFLKSRAGDASGEGMLDILNRVPSRGVVPGDEF
jgi:HicB family